MPLLTRVARPELLRYATYRTVLITAALLATPLVHAEYDFNNPAYAVHNTPDTSTEAGAAQARADAIEARKQQLRDDFERRLAEARERDEHQAELNRIRFEQEVEERRKNAPTYTQQEVVIDRNGKEIDYKQFMRDHPGAVDHGNFVSYTEPGSGLSYDSSTGSASNAFGLPMGHFYGVRFYLLGLLLLSFGGWLLRFFFGTDRNTSFRPSFQNDGRAYERGAQLSAAMAGNDIPLAMRKAEPPAPVPAATPFAAPAAAASSKTEPEHDPSQPIEFVRPILGAAAAAEVTPAPVVESPAPAPAPAAVGGTTLWAQTQLELFAKDQSPEPILYASQVKKIGLDYSAESLARLDLFLQQLRQKANPQQKDYSERFQHRNLMILLGLYIGTTVARLTSQPIKWYDYSGAKTLLDRKGYHESIQCAYTCMLGRTDHYMPIELVWNILFGDDSSLSCVSSLAHHQQRAALA